MNKRERESERERERERESDSREFEELASQWAPSYKERGFVCQPHFTKGLHAPVFFSVKYTGRKTASSQTLVKSSCYPKNLSSQNFCLCSWFYSLCEDAWRVQVQRTRTGNVSGVGYRLASAQSIIALVVAYIWFVYCISSQNNGATDHLL